MAMRNLVSPATLSALLASLVLVACGGDSPESMLASAKEYIAKNDNKAAVIQLKNALQANPSFAEARFLLGKSLLESGNPSGAEIELLKASELKYSADEVTPLLARAQLMLGQSKKVVDEWSAIQLKSPESSASLKTTVGQALLSLGKIETAQSSFEAAISVSPDFAPAIVGLARIKAANRDLVGALAALDTALGKQPRFYEALQLRGDIFGAQGDSKAAVDAYQKVLEIKPDSVAAHSALVGRFLEEGKFEDAVRQLDSMKKAAPNHPQTSYLQAQVSYRKKEFKEAQTAIQQYLKALPDSGLGLQFAGAIEYELKSYSTAETYLQKALPKTPELGLARRVLIASYLRSGQPDKALGVLQPVLDKIDKNSNMLALAGEVFMQNGDAAKAETFFTKAAALDPENTGKRTSVALSHLAKGETETAYKELEEVAAVDSGIKADLALIASQLRARKFDQALKSTEALEKKQPENPLAHNLRGAAYLGKSDIAAARKSFEQALAKNPGYFPAAASLANLDLADKKPDEAKKRFEGVIAKDPKNIQAMLALAELKAKTGGKPDEVAVLISNAISASPNEVAPRLALIGLHLGANDTKKALSAAQEALGVLPNSPEILDAAGRAQQASGDFNQALSSYGKMASLMPNSVQPYLRLAEVQVAAKDKTAAMQSLRKALAIKADSIEAQRGIMMLDLDAGRTDEALTMARQVQKQRPKEAVGYILEGDVHALKKAWTEAAAVYRNGIKQSGATELAIKLHAVLGASGSAIEADRFAESWIRDHAKDMKFRLYLAESANARKDYASATKQYRILVDAQPNNPAMLNNLAWSLAQINDPKAIEFAEKAYKLSPDQPAILDTLGVMLVEKGDANRGLELLQKANSLAPQNALIRLNLAKALVKAGKKEAAKKELDELAKLGDKFPSQAEVAKLLQSL